MSGPHMTDPIQAAIEKADEACPCRIRHGRDTEKMCGEIACWCYSLKIDREKMAFGWPGDQDKRPVCKWPGHAAIRSLAALVKKYGHVAGCECGTKDVVVPNGTYWMDIRCRERRPLEGLDG